MAFGTTIRYNFSMILVRTVFLVLILLGGCSDESTETGETSPDVVVTPSDTGAPDTPETSKEPDVVVDDTGGGEPVCTPGTTLSTCIAPKEVSVCRADGSGFENAFCPGLEFCFEGRCRDWGCVPGSRGCSTGNIAAVCLTDGADGYEWSTVETCAGACKLGECVGDCGFDVKQNIGKDCGHFVINLTGTGSGECAAGGQLAVPSSVYDEIAVYDLTLDPPALTEGSPFPTCDNPSRILLSQDGKVTATCRDDGRVHRHEPNGTLIWGVQLPSCDAVRGVVELPNGRLFAGCTSTGNVHELDPANGDVLDTVDSGLAVYGMAATETAVFVMDATGVARINIDGGLSVGWSESAFGYGVAADATGRVWLTEPPGLVARDAETGTVVLEVEIESVVEAAQDSDNPNCNGVAMTVDGRVITGCADTDNAVVIYDPQAELVERLPLPEGANHPRGVAADADGNLYSVNKDSQNLTRFPASGDPPTSFGTGELGGPYGYSGDLTAVTPCLYSGAPTVWTSPLLTYSGPDTNWVAVEWTAIEPAGTQVEMWHRIDGGPWVTTTNGAAINQTGTTFQVRARLLAPSDAEAGPTLEEVAVFYE